MTDPQPPTLPNYQKPGIPLADKKQQGPLMKVIGRMMSARLPKMMKGKISPQSIKFKHKKVKFY